LAAGPAATDVARVVISSAAGEGERWWWLGTLVIVRVAGDAVGGRYSLMEFAFPHGASPPRHSHPQDETMIVLEGELTFVCGDERVVVGAGAVAAAPAGAAHTFRVDSETARALVLSTPAGIEQLPRASGVEALAPTLPPADARRPPAEELARVFAEHGLVIAGPPLAADE
jgi:quercetin dioxygenase-like cupin family protein